MPLTCLCIPGSIILALVSLTMTLGLYRYHKKLGDEMFTAALMGFALITTGQILHSFHAVYHIVEPIMYSPSLRVAVSAAELTGYTAVFWALQSYFKRFGEI